MDELTNASLGCSINDAVGHFENGSLVVNISTDCAPPSQPDEEFENGIPLSKYLNLSHSDFEDTDCSKQHIIEDNQQQNQHLLDLIAIDEQDMEQSDAFIEDYSCHDGEMKENTKEIVGDWNEFSKYLDEEEYGSDSHELASSDIVFGDGDTTIIIEVDSVNISEDSEQIYLYPNMFRQEEEEDNVLQSVNLQNEEPAHVIIDNTSPDDRTCSLCNFMFETHDDYIQHVQDAHPVEPCPETSEFKCPFCNYKSKNKTSVKQHIRTHTKEKPFKCGVCQKAFSQKAGVQQHMRSHSEVKPWKCQYCDSSFKAQNTLLTHISMTHKKLKPYKCRECHQSFGHISNLKTHMRTHTKERPFRCTFCSKTFTQLGHLNTHMRVHTGDRPFKCKHCSADFTHVGNLNQHTITQHTKKLSLCV